MESPRGKPEIHAVSSTGEVQKPQEPFSLRYSIFLVVLVSLCYVVNAMDRALFPQLVSYIRQEFKFTLAQGGFLATVFTLGMGLGGIPAGYLIDRTSRKTVAIAGVIVYSLFTILNAYSAGFWEMAGVRVLTGCGEAMQQTALFTLVGAYFYRNRNMAIGSLNVAYGLGQFLGPLLGIRVFLWANQQWKMPLVAFGLLGLVFAGVFALFVPRQFTEAKGGAKNVRGGLDDSHIPDKLWTRNLVLLSMAHTLIGFANFGYLGLYPTFLKSQLHFSASDAAFCASWYGIGALMGLPGGFLGDKLKQKWVIFFGIGGAMLAGFLIFNVATARTPQAMLSFVQGACVSGLLFVNTSGLAQRSVRKAYIGRASGISSSTHYFPSAFAGMSFGWLVTHYGWGKAALVQMVLLPIVTILTMLLYDERQAAKLLPVSKQA
jgi:MFS family permease